MNPRASTNNTGSASEAERRRHGRFRQDGLQSSLGPVLDISASGIRLMSRRRVNGVIEVVLKSESGLELKVSGRVVWCRREGFRRHLVGLELVELSSAKQRLLTRISMGG